MANYDGIKLNKQQEAAAYDTEGAVLVIAGAGSGKTRVLTARIANLIKIGIPQSNILAITFTNKAANEMKERLAVTLGGECYVWTSTFHSFCAKILRYDGDKIGYTSNFTIYTESESVRVVKRILDELEEDSKLKSNILWHISNAKNKGFSPEEYFKEIQFDVVNANIICECYLRYEKFLRQSNALDFDDLLLKAVELFETSADTLEKYASKFKYINVDEFQDTNYIQLKLLKLLSSVHKNIFVVGDEDQSIYSWRGAEIKNILDFEKIFNGAKVYKLEQNYRSTMPILEAANNVIKNNHLRQEKTLWSEISKGDAICYSESSSDREESTYVAKQINKLFNEGVNYRDIAVLVRVNSLTRNIEETFRLHSIPYKIFGGFNFFERKEIKDFISYLRMAVNPKDNDAVLRNINNPKRGIGDSSLQKLAKFAEGKSIDLSTALAICEMSELNNATKSKLKAFYEIEQKLIRCAKTLTPSKFAELVLKESGFENTLATGDEEAITRLENMKELVASIALFERDNKDATIETYLEQVSLISDTDEMDGENYVTIATIHAVKGLEFENVFVVGLEETIFPVSRAMNGGDIEEERRLMYVAITRAKQRLFVCWAKSRFRFNEYLYNPKSRFIDEMVGKKLIVKQTIAKPSFETYKSTYMTSQKVASKSNVDYSKFKQNTIIEHAKFGRGIITASEGSGEDITLSIMFKGLGVKKFALSIAINSLKIVED